LRDVKVTDLRSHLPAFLAAVQGGEEIRILSRGKVVARLVPERCEVEAARARLIALRGTARLGDLISPLDQPWDAER
jgi:antitoxin (DNA-binding transcriptional repressor) of toxin-antitoxin stability system